MTREVTIVTYISSKKQDIIPPTLINDDKYSFQVLPFYFEWNGKKGEINRIEIRNDRMRYDTPKKKDESNVEKYRKFAPETTQTDTYSNGQVSIYFRGEVAHAEIEGQTLIIDGSHYTSMWRGFCFEPFELVGIDEDWNKGRDNKLILKIKERGITNNSHNSSWAYFSPTITEFLINFGTTGAGMHEYAAKLQVGKKYHFNGDRLENAKILAGKKLDLNNSADKVPEIRVFNEEGEIITHGYPHNDNSRIKEKLLRNLDKLCLDPGGYLANNEYLKMDGAEEEYQKLFSGQAKDWKNRYLKIVIDGEEIDLEDWDNTCPEYYEVKRELIKKIKQEIKQNPSEWKIEKGKNENYAVESNNRLIKHVSGQRHWKFAISYLWGGNNSERIKNWTEIEALINRSPVPKFNDNDKNNQISDTEKEKIRQFLQKNGIKEVKFENGKLIITYNNNNETKTFQQISHDPELLEIKEYCQKANGNKITQESLKPGSDNNLTSPKTPLWKNKYVWLASGILMGVAITAVIIACCRRKKIKNN